MSLPRLSAALVLVGFAAGLACGYFAFHSPAATPRQVDTRHAPPGPPPERRAPRETVRPAQPDAPPAPTEPPPTPEPAAWDPGFGLFELDTRGIAIKVAMLSGMGLLADDLDGVTAEPDADGIARFRLRAGAYRLTWNPRDDEHGVPVRVVAGETTRVRAADLPAPDAMPPPPGAGRLVVRALDPRGEPLAISFWLTGWDMVEEQTIREATRADGSCRLELRPGAMRVRVGTRVETATVVAGEETEVVFRPAGEGEIVFDGKPRRIVVLRRAGTREWLHVGAWKRDGVFVIPFVTAGSWEVAQDTGRRRLETVRVAAGGSALVRVPAYLGRIVIRARPSQGAFFGTSGDLVVEGLDRSANALGVPRRVAVPHKAPTAEFQERNLAPGRYRVRLSLNGFGSAETEVEVGVGPVEVEMVMEK